jgi:hypothetical protein
MTREIWVLFTFSQTALVFYFIFQLLPGREGSQLCERKKGVVFFSVFFRRLCVYSAASVPGLECTNITSHRVSPTKPDPPIIYGAFLLAICFVIFLEDGVDRFCAKSLARLWGWW